MGCTTQNTQTQFSGVHGIQIHFRGREGLIAAMSTLCDARRGAWSRDPAIRSSDAVPRHVSSVPRDAHVVAADSPTRIRENPVGALRSCIDQIHVVDRRRRTGSCGASGFLRPSCSPSTGSYFRRPRDGRLIQSASVVISGRRGILRFPAAKFSRRNSILDILSN